MKLTGQVIKRHVSAGSKSERDAVMIVTSDREFILRRIGGNPFQDAVLDALVGKQLQCEGQLNGPSFIMKSWNELAK